MKWSKDCKYDLFPESPGKCFCAVQAAVCSVRYLDFHYHSSVKPAAAKELGWRLTCKVAVEEAVRCAFLFGEVIVGSPLMPLGHYPGLNKCWMLFPVFAL